MQYVVTFHSHFGATRFARHLRDKDIPCVLKPVPRRLSSSCGTCAQFETEGDALPLVTDDVDGLYRPAGEGYEQLWKSEE